MTLERVSSNRIDKSRRISLFLFAMTRGLTVPD